MGGSSPPSPFPHRHGSFNLMRPAAVFAAISLGGLALAACQPMPHPFADDRPPPKSAALMPPDSPGVLVMPVTGADATGPRLAEAMAAALRDNDVPADTTAANRGSYRLAGTASAEPEAGGMSRVTIAWELRDGVAMPIGHASASAEVPSGPWENGEVVPPPALTRPVAAELAKLIISNVPAPAAPAQMVVAVKGVSGAPGDGNTTLSRAIGDILSHRDIALAKAGGDRPAYVLSCTVTVAPAGAGQQQVKLDWELARPEGQAIGHVNQENAVPTGTLDGPWGDIAFAVASAAGPGITTLIEGAKEADARQSAAPAPPTAAASH